MGYSAELNKLIRELIEEEAPYYHKGNQEYDRHGLAAAVLSRLEEDHEEYEVEFTSQTREAGMLGKVNGRLASPKTILATGGNVGDEDGPFQMRFNLNIPIAGRREGAMKPIYHCTLREVMLDAEKRGDQIEANRVVLRQEQNIIKYMLENGAELDDHVRDFFVEAA